MQPNTQVFFEEFAKSKPSNRGGDFLFVECHFPDDFRNNPRKEMIHRDDLELFISDMVRRHVDPGVDPVTKAKQLFLERITVAEPEVERDAWYSQRRVGQFPDQVAPRRLIKGESRTVWLHPDYAAEVAANEEQMLAEEAGMNE